MAEKKRKTTDAEDSGSEDSDGDQKSNSKRQRVAGGASVNDTGADANAGGLGDLRNNDAAEDFAVPMSQTSWYSVKSNIRFCNM
jgi:hypothetical protein